MHTLKTVVASAMILGLLMGGTAFAAHRHKDMLPEKPKMVRMHGHIYMLMTPRLLQWMHDHGMAAEGHGV